MRKLIAVALFAASPAFAAPFVVADVVAGVASCGVLLDSGEKVTVPAIYYSTNNECRFDVGSVSPGAHVVRMTAQTANDPVWGTQESAESAPLNFTRPSPPGAPSGLTLRAQ